jgi:hypothetical protein
MGELLLVLGGYVKMSTNAPFNRAVASTNTVDLRDFNGYSSTGLNDQTSTVQNAINQLQTLGSGTLFIPGVTLPCGQLNVQGGAPTLNGGYQGGIQIVGEDKVRTKFQATGSKLFVVDVTATPTGGNSAMAMLAFKNFHISGLGRASTGSVGFDVGPQGAYQMTPNDILFDQIWMSDFENLCRFDDTTTLHFYRNYFTNYVKAIRLGYNHDNMLVEFCRFGENQQAIGGAQSEIAIAYDYISPRFPGATTLGGAQNHRYQNNWFMRQGLVMDIWDPSASDIHMDGNYFESCLHYAQIGNATTTQAPTRVIWQNNTFARVAASENIQTQAMFKFMHANAFGSFTLKDNTCDTIDGPKYGWITSGSASSINYDNNSLPATGTGVVSPYHLMVGTKNIVVPNGNKYQLGNSSVVGNTQQFNASGQDGIPNTSVEVNNASSTGTVMARYTTRAASSEGYGGPSVANGGPHLDIGPVSIANGDRYCLVMGGVKTLQGTALPTAHANLRGVSYLTQGGTGVADTLKMCIKDSSDAYVWKSITLS